LNDLNEALRRSLELPVRLEAVPVIEIRLKAVKEWVNTLKNCFIKTESSNASSNHISQVSFVNSNKTIMELLTPRIDLISIVNKILNSHSSSSSMSNPSTSKRQRTKSPNGSIIINTDNESSINKNNLLNSLVSIENVEEFYSENKFISVLTEKYKTLQLKEVEHMKQLRKLNQDKINSQLNFIIKAQDTSEDATTNQTGLNNSINNDQSSSSNTSLKFQNQKFPINIKCCSCFKSIASAINTNCAQQCKLCLGLFHSMSIFVC
jgi:hypothetical protein